MGDLLKNKFAIITGGGRGIGRAIAERFAQEGCDLLLAARTKSELENSTKAIRSKYGVQVKYQAIDISDDNSVHSMVEQAISEFGKIDILVNNAAIIGPMGEITDINIEDFFNTLRINLGGTVLCAQTVAKHMKKNNCGTIINLSGGGALYPLPFYDAYSASKAAVVRLTENFAIEFEKYNITVAAISPGAVNTKMFEEQLALNKEIIGENNWLNLQQRLQSGGDSIAKAPELAVYIASDKRTELNGRVISAIWDDWVKISDNKDRVTNSDFYKMRRIIPKDRGMNF